MRIHVGCCGFALPMKKYFDEFKTIELQSTFYKLPKTDTTQRWRELAPKDFIFSVKSFQGITHPTTSPTWRRSGIKLRAVEIAPKGWKRLKKRSLGIRAKGSMLRKENVIEYTTVPERWKKRIGYGKRWTAEMFFSAFKRIFGEHVGARRFENMVNELMMKSMLYNLFVGL